MLKKRNIHNKVNSLPTPSARDSLFPQNTDYLRASNSPTSPYWTGHNAVTTCYLGGAVKRLQRNEFSDQLEFNFASVEFLRNRL